MKKILPVLFVIPFLISTSARADNYSDDLAASSVIIAGGLAGCAVVGSTEAIYAAKHYPGSAARAGWDGCKNGALIGSIVTLGVGVGAAVVSSAMADEAPTDAQLNNSDTSPNDQE